MLSEIKIFSLIQTEQVKAMSQKIADDLSLKIIAAPKEYPKHEVNRRTQDKNSFQHITKNKRPCHSIWLFYFCNTLKIYILSDFPLIGSIIGAFYWLFIWNFNKIKHQPFPMTQPTKISISYESVQIKSPSSHLVGRAFHPHVKPAGGIR